MAESWRRWIPIGRRNVRTDVDDELRFQIEMRTRDLIAEGHPTIRRSDDPTI